MKKKSIPILGMLVMFANTSQADDAISFLGQDVEFPNKVEGLPERLSDVENLQINEFTTNDNVTIRYWEAGDGPTLIITPGWGTNGAYLINDIALLSQHFHVYVMDYRNHGLSQQVAYGNSVARLATDVNQMLEHLNIESAYFCGWSMGASVLWSYIDLFGTSRMERVAFVDEPVSIYSHVDWSEEERLRTGAFVTSAELAAKNITGEVEVNNMIAEWPKTYPTTPAKQNSDFFEAEVIDVSSASMGLVQFDHQTNDWSEVIRHKIDVPAAIFAADNSVFLESQRWIARTIPNAQIYEYTEADFGDHDMMAQNPIKFTDDLTSFFLNN